MPRNTGLPDYFAVPSFLTRVPPAYPRAVFKSAIEVRSALVPM
jgi:hypothetical protein